MHKATYPYMHVALNLRSGDPFTQNSNVLSSPGTYEEEHPAMTSLFNLQNIEYYFKWGRDEWVLTPPPHLFSAQGVSMNEPF